MSYVCGCYYAGVITVVLVASVVLFLILLLLPLSLSICCICRIRRYVFLHTLALNTWSYIDSVYS